MKKINSLFTFLFLVAACVIYPQNGETGIYKSATDFLNGKKTHSGKDTRVRLHRVFKKELIEVKINDSTFTYKKKDVYGYFDEDGFVYRFFKGEIYPILNPTEKIIIYKTISGAGTKNSALTENYFFSTDAAAEILPLSLKNIELAFSGNAFFQELLEVHFKNDAELKEYDKLHKMYKLNRLLGLSEAGKIK